MQRSSSPTEGELTGYSTSNLNMSIGDNNRATSNKGMGKRPGKRPGRKPSKIDERAKLERSRQSARECRARKKLRYQYLEELVLNREKAVFALRDELQTYKEWCVSLEHGGQLPDSLLKMLANDDVSINRRQIEQVKRSLRQSQYQKSSSPLASSTSPDASPPQQMQQSNLWTPRLQGLEGQSGSVSSSHRHDYPQNNPFGHNQHQLQNQAIQQVKETSSTAPLQRQMAFDHTNPPHQNQLPNLPQLTNPQNLSNGQTRTNIFASQPKAGNQLQPHQQQFMMHQQNPDQLRINNSMPQKAFSFQQSNNLQRATTSWKSHESSLFKDTNEPPTNYIQSFEGFNKLPKIGQDNSQISQGGRLQGAGEPSRRRSLSNPASMTSQSRPNTHATSSHDLPRSLQDFITSHNSSGSHSDHHGSFLGLFTGNLIGGAASFSSSSIPPSITVEDSSSSDETMDEKYVNKSSLISQKREQTIPFFSEISHEEIMDVTNSVSLNPLTSNFDIKAKNMNQSNARNTHTTHSPSWCGLTTSIVASPTQNLSYGGVSASNLSSSSGASATPLSSLSSFLELYAASGLPSASFEIPSPSTPNRDVPSQITSSDLNSFIHHPVPEWYSFLDDLQDGTISTLTTHHMTSSAHNPSVSMTSRSHDQPLTSNPSFMNVPNIIDEILDPNDHIL